MVDFMLCFLTNLLFFDIPLLYCYTNLNSSIICCLPSGDMYLSLFFLFHYYHQHCASMIKIFLMHLLFYQQLRYQLNHQLLLLFLNCSFWSSFYCIRFRCFSTIEKFFTLLLKFLLMFLTKDKNAYPFVYILSLGSIEYLIFIQRKCIQWNRI